MAVSLPNSPRQAHHPETGEAAAAPGAAPSRLRRYRLILIFPALDFIWKSSPNVAPPTGIGTCRKFLVLYRVFKTRKGTAAFGRWYAKVGKSKMQKGRGQGQTVNLAHSLPRRPPAKAAEVTPTQGLPKATISRPALRPTQPRPKAEGVLCSLVAVQETLAGTHSRFLSG